MTTLKQFGPRWLLWPLAIPYAVLTVLGEVVFDWLSALCHDHSDHAADFILWIRYRFDGEALFRLTKANPDRFIVTDVMYVCKISKWFARRILKTAVRQGIFAQEGECYRLIEKDKP